MSVKALAQSLPSRAFRTIAWREGSNAPLRERFAAVRVRHAGGNVGEARLRPEQWLLIEWPANDKEPSKYFLSTLPADTPINELVSVAHQRWRIERDRQDLKQDFGLGHYEGRGWRGTCIAGSCARAPLECHAFAWAPKVETAALLGNTVFGSRLGAFTGWKREGESQLKL